VVWLKEEMWTEHDFMAITGQIRVPWSPEKMRPFATTQRYNLGFDWNLNDKSVMLPASKLQAICDLLHEWSCE
jgi:hypothetical protein